MGTSIKYVRSEREEGGQCKSYICCFYDVTLLFESVQRGGGSVLKSTNLSYVLYGWSLYGSFIYEHVAMFFIEIWYLWYFLYNYSKFNTFYINSIQQNHFSTLETIIWLCSCIKEIYDLYLKALFCYWATF